MKKEIGGDFYRKKREQKREEMREIFDR